MPLLASLSSADGLVEAYVCPAALQSVVTVSLFNHGAEDTVTLYAVPAVDTGGAPVNRHILDRATLSAGGLLSRSGIALGVGDKLYVAASGAGVAINIAGIQSAA